MTDGTGTTTYAYYPIPPADPRRGQAPERRRSARQRHDHVRLRRARAGDVTADRQRRQHADAAFDALGRLTTLTNPLGHLHLHLRGRHGPARRASPTRTASRRPTPTSTTSATTACRRSTTRSPGGATLSKFNYTYDAVGNILTWRQQADVDPAKVYEFGYDDADQLTAAILKSTDPTPADPQALLLRVRPRREPNRRADRRRRDGAGPTTT